MRREAVGGRMALAEGMMLGPYRVEQQLGSGGMATIYKAYHARLDRHVAIKMMHQAFLQDTTFVARFEREAQIVARLEHSNIVPIFDFAEHEGQPYLVMKYIEGRTLKALMERASGLPLNEVVRILPLLADALDYAHRQGVLHRDIKPSNIILGKDGTPYLTDFGLARLAQLGESTLSSDMLLGTPHYISPEQAQGQRDLDNRTDLYSFGVVVYELLVGRVPFSADTPFAVIHDHIYRPIPSPASLNPELPPMVERVLVKALAKKPADRYPTAAEMVRDLLSAIRDSGLTALNPDRRALASSSEAREREQSAHDIMASAADAEALPDNQTLHVATPIPVPVPVVAASAAPPRRSVDDDNTYNDDDHDPSAAYPLPEKGKRVTVETSFDFGNLGEKLRDLGPKIEAWAPKIEEWAEKIEASVDNSSGGVQINFGGRDDELAPPDDINALRRRAERQVKKKNEFFGHVVAYVMVNLLMWVIFGFTGPSEFAWPLVVNLGWGAGLVAHAIETFFETGKRAARRIIRVHQEFEHTYGPRWWENASKQELRKVRKRVEEPIKKWQEFYSHAAVFVVINAMLWAIFGMIGGAADGGMFPWPLIVMFGWGIGLVANFFEAAGSRRSQRAVDREIEAEMALRYGQGKAKRKNDSDYDTVSLDDLDVEEPRIRLTGDGELTESMAQELDPRLRRRDR